MPSTAIKGWIAMLKRSQSIVNCPRSSRLLSAFGPLAPYEQHSASSGTSGRRPNRASLGEPFTTTTNPPRAESLRQLVAALHGAARLGARAQSSSVDLMRTVQAYINAHSGEPLRQPVISRCCAMSPSHFSRTFHHATGSNFKQFVLLKRIEKSQTLLGASDLRVKEIAHLSGFHNMAYFTRAFKKHTGISPSTYRQTQQHITGTKSSPKATEASIQQNEARLRLLLDAVRDYGIFMLDIKGRVTTWNGGAQHMKGYTAEDIIGQHFSCFYMPKAIAAGQPHIALEIAKREGRYEEEGWRVRKDGSRFLANVIINTVYDAQHRLCGFANITREITRYRRYSEMLFLGICSLHQSFEPFIVTSAALAFTF